MTATSSCSADWHSYSFALFIRRSCYWNCFKIIMLLMKCAGKLPAFHLSFDFTHMYAFINFRDFSIYGMTNIFRKVFSESIIFVILRQDLWTKQKMCESQQDSPFNTTTIWIHQQNRVLWCFCYVSNLFPRQSCDVKTVIIFYCLNLTVWWFCWSNGCILLLLWLCSLKAHKITESLEWT